MFDIEFYELPNGDKPVEKFMIGLDKKMRVKAEFDLARKYKADYERSHCNG